MQKIKTVMGLCLLVTIGAAGCKSDNQPQQRPTISDQNVKSERVVDIDKLPPDVIRTVHQHVMWAHLLNAGSITVGGRMAYLVYARSGNTVYVLKIRPNGYYLGMGEDDDVMSAPSNPTIYR